ncbi:MAG: hypothetical protein M3Y05_14265 [Gemmatimonadota bacterium]|nr:hypothetical protein [Gemmatimonadota bacterium]
MSSNRELRRRKVEVALIVAILLIGWYISPSHHADGPATIIHWISAALAAWFLGSAAWSIIKNPKRIFLALGYLMFGIAMSLQFIGDLAPPANASNLGAISLAAMSAGFLLLWMDHDKNGSAAPPDYGA